MPLKSSKINTYINFAIKSGNIILGLDEIEKKLKKCKVIIYFENLSNSSLENLKSKANNVNLLKLDMQNDYLASKNVKVFAITDENLANAILNL